MPSLNMPFAREKELVNNVVSLNAYVLDNILIDAVYMVPWGKIFRKEIIDSQGGFVRAYFAGTPEDEVRIREETGATPRCILPNTGTGKCIITGKPDGRLTIFAKAY